MSAPVTLVLIGLLYVVLFGGLALLRREGLSLQFALEAVAITALAAGLAALTNWGIGPIALLIVLYLITMRARLLVDLGNLLARRKQFDGAARVYTLANTVWPDKISRLIVQLNQAVLLLQCGALDEAIAAFKDILQTGQGYLGIKHQAAAHYNLGVAYRRKKLDAQATAEFNTVLDLWPVSEYARRAAAALEQGRRKEQPAPSQNDTPSANS